jgi:hypothetical protein
LHSIASAAFAIVVFSARGLALAQSPPPSPPPLEDYYDGNYGHFLHRSGVVTFAGFGNGALRNSLRYSICNFDPNDGLIFQWNKPGFGTGWYYPLVFRKCLAMSLDSGEFFPDYSAPILFTQNNQIKNASAYLPDSRVTTPSTSRVEVPYTQNSTTSIVEFSIRVSVDNKGQATCFITWSQGVPAVAIAFNLPEEVLRRAIEALEKQGVRVRSAKAVDLVDERDFSYLSNAARDSTFIELSSTEGRPFTGQFSYQPVRNETSIDPVLLLDADKHVIARSSYRSIR